MTWPHSQLYEKTFQIFLICSVASYVRINKYYQIKPNIFFFHLLDVSSWVFKSHPWDESCVKQEKKVTNGVGAVASGTLHIFTLTNLSISNELLSITKKCSMSSFIVLTLYVIINVIELFNRGLFTTNIAQDRSRIVLRINGWAVCVFCYCGCNTLICLLCLYCFMQLYIRVFVLLIKHSKNFL